MSPKKKRAYAIGQYGAGNQDVSPIYSISKEMPFNFQSSTIQPSRDAPSEMQAKTLDSPLKVQDGATNRTSDDSLIEGNVQDPDLLKAIELKNAINVFQLHRLLLLFDFVKHGRAATMPDENTASKDDTEETNVQPNSSADNQAVKIREDTLAGHSIDIDQLAVNTAIDPPRSKKRGGSRDYKSVGKVKAYTTRLRKPFEF